MLCANCSDIDLFAILKGDHKGKPLKWGHEVWITRTSDPTAIWVWDSQPDCEFCGFLSATQSNLIPQNASFKPWCLQLDRGKSFVRDYDRFGPSMKLSPHVNIVFDSPDGSPEQHLWSDPNSIVSFGVPTDTEMSDFQPHPLRVDEIPTWLDLSSIKRHLQNCSHNHGSCYQQKEASSSRPSRLRLIDCSTESIVTPPSDTPYVALSYRWSKSQTESQDQQMNVQPPKFSATVKDAIRVTQSLGLQYLWVDAHCVLQKDENDFKHQIRQMHLIYRSAQITIIASGGMDASSGLIGVSTPRANGKTKGQYGKLNLITFSLFPWASIYVTGEWIRRGWTLQEGYFSQRRLIFTDEQVLFDCDEGVVSEDIQHSQILYRGKLEKWRPNANGGKVYNLVFSYTARTLTYDSDILDAFDGILGDFEQREPAVRSHWGIPLIADTFGYLNGLLIGLCWCHPIHDERISRRPDFPSWSWAGWVRNSFADYTLRTTPNTEFMAAPDVVIRVEKKDGLIETWGTFEEVSPASIQRHQYSRRIHVSAPSLKIALRIKMLTWDYFAEIIVGHGAFVVRNEEDDFWATKAYLDSPFDSLELSSVTCGSSDTRTCYAIYLFSADMMMFWYDGTLVHNTFALLLVTKMETNWERVGLCTLSFESKEEAQDFEQWLQSSSTYETRDFCIA